MITLNDWNRLDFFLLTLPGDGGSSSFYDFDVTGFVQNAINSNQQFVGFTLWQSYTTNGMTFENGSELILSANVDFDVPAPVSFPEGEQSSPVPEPTTLLLFSAGLLGAFFRRRA